LEHSKEYQRKISDNQKQFIFLKNDEIVNEESFEYHAYSSKITNEELK
jgi:hypothetical protein